MSDSRIKVGVIGLGALAQLCYLPSLERLSSLYEIVAICDVSSELLQAIGVRYNVKKRYLDGLELCADPDIEAVFIMNSDEFHVECALAAFENKKHAIIEKPMCFTPEDARRIIEARDAAGKKAIVGYSRSYCAATRALHDEVSRMGPITYVSARHVLGFDYFEPNREFVHVPKDIPQAAIDARKARAKKNLEDFSKRCAPEKWNVMNMMTGVCCHDIAGLRSAIGAPERVSAAFTSGDNSVLSVTFDYPGFKAQSEYVTGNYLRCQTNINVFSANKIATATYNSYFVRADQQDTITITENKGDSLSKCVRLLPLKDMYTQELEHYYDVVRKDAEPISPLEFYQDDLNTFYDILARI